MRHSHFDLNQQQPLFFEFLLNTGTSGLTSRTNCKHYPSQNCHLASCSQFKNPAVTFQDISPFSLWCPPLYQVRGVLNLIFYPFTVYSIFVPFLSSTCWSLGQWDHSLLLKMSSSKMGFIPCLTYLYLSYYCNSWSTHKFSKLCSTRG